MTMDDSVLREAEKKFRYTWFIVGLVAPLAVLCILFWCRMVGWISDQPLELTRFTYSLKLGSIISLPIGLFVIWLDSKRLFSVPYLGRLTSAPPGSRSIPPEVRAMSEDTQIRWFLLRRIRMRSFAILGGLNGNFGILIVLYLIVRMDWLLALTGCYSIVATWYFRPRTESLIEKVLSASLTKQ